MGSLNDVFIYPANAALIDRDEVAAVNARLRQFVETITHRARAVPAVMPWTPQSQAVLAIPALEHLPEYVAALERGWSPDNVRPVETAREHLSAIAHDPVDFLAQLNNSEAKGLITLPDGTQAPRLPGINRWLWDDGFCGRIGFRWQPGTSALPSYVLGHIGFSVVPWRRGMGHAKRALGLMLQEARRIGLDYVELTTDPTNTASQAVIQANAGILVEWFTKDTAYGGGDALRYRIRL